MILVYMTFKPFGPYGQTWPSEEDYHWKKRRFIERQGNKGIPAKTAEREWNKYYREKASEQQAKVLEAKRGRKTQEARYARRKKYKRIRRRGERLP